MEEEKLFLDYLKCYCDLWWHFCASDKKTPKTITDEVLFRKEFTFERFKKGFWTYRANKSLTYTFSEDLGEVKLKRLVCSLSYNLYRDVPFNISYEI